MNVAAYCRVSTDKEDQWNSLESQKAYFEQYIQRHPDWELYKIYADEGISGTGTKKRAAFNRMMNDAYDGKFSLILTKERGCSHINAYNIFTLKLLHLYTFFEEIVFSCNLAAGNNTSLLAYRLKHKAQCISRA